MTSRPSARRAPASVCLLMLAAVTAAGVTQAQEPPPGYRVRIGGDGPAVDPLAPAEDQDTEDAAENAEAGADGDDAAPGSVPGARPAGEPSADGRVEPDAASSMARQPTADPATATPRRSPDGKASKAGKVAGSKAARKTRRKKTRRPKHTRWAREPAVTPLEAARTLERTPGAVIEFDRPIAFAHDSVKLSAGGDAALTAVVDYLQAAPEIRLVLIEGHTDATGSLRYNQALSEARAVAIRAALIRAGVSPDRLVAYGYGETRPAEPDRAANRRVVFRIIEGDRPALKRREASEWGEAALVDARGTVEIAAVVDESSPDPAVTAAMPERPDDAAPAPLPDRARSSAPPPGAMALFIAPAPASAAAPATAEMPESASPDAMAAPDRAGEWRPWAVRGQLAEGHDIRIGPASHALLRLPDLGRLWLGPETRVRLSRLHHDRDDGKTYLAVRVDAGTVRAMLNPLERSISRTLLALPGGGLELVAADFELQVQPDGTGRLRVDRGRLELTAGQRSHSVFAGQTTRLGHGGAEPKAQLPPPTAQAPLDGTFERAPLLQWAAVSGALGYRVEIAADVDFTRPVVGARTTEARFAPRVLTPDRAWYWRVRAIDADGSTGSASRIHRFRTAPRVESPPAAAGLQPRNRTAP